MCISISPSHPRHAEMHEYGKARGMTVVYAPWHPEPQYRIFKTGSLLSRNEQYPSGLVIVEESGKTTHWSDWRF